MPSLSEKIGDNLQKIRQRAEDAFLTLAAHGQFGVKVCLQALASEQAPTVKGKKMKKPMMTSK